MLHLSISRLRCLVLLLIPMTGAAIGHPGADDRIRVLTDMLARQPDSQLLFIERGSVWSVEGEFDHALSDFRHAETLGDPLSVAFEMGVLYYRKGEFSTARRYFDTTLTAFPNHAPSLEYRARVLRDAGEFEMAIADLTTFLALSSQPNPGHYVAAAKLLLHEDGRNSEIGIAAAIKILDQGIEQIGLVPQLQQFAIELELKRGAPEAAINRQLTMQEMLGSSPQWHLRIGELLAIAGDEEQSRAHGRIALAQLKTLRKTPAHIRMQDQAMVLAMVPTGSGQ